MSAASNTIILMVEHSWEQPFWQMRSHAFCRPCIRYLSIGSPYSHMEPQNLKSLFCVTKVTDHKDNPCPRKRLKKETSTTAIRSTFSFHLFSSLTVQLLQETKFNSLTQHRRKISYAAFPASSSLLGLLRFGNWVGLSDHWLKWEMNTIKQCLSNNWRPRLGPSHIC